jgi:Tetratricopeptide repeat
MNMSSSLVAAELNNLGVVRLSQGDLRGALDLFRESLSYTAGSLSPYSLPPSSTNSAKEDVAVHAATTTGTSSPTNLSDPAAHHPSSPYVAPPPHHHHHVTMVSTPFVHSNGINVIPMATAYSSDILINMAIVSSIVVFNLAIVCHLKGLEGGPASNSRLLKAKSLYERSQRLLTDVSIPGHYSLGNPVTDMIAMASLNNLAQLNYEMSQYEESRNCFDRLVGFACTIVPGQYGDAYVGSLMDRTKSSFLLNAIILQKPGLAPAA